MTIHELLDAIAAKAAGGGDPVKVVAIYEDGMKRLRAKAEEMTQDFIELMAAVEVESLRTIELEQRVSDLSWLVNGDRQER